MRVTELLQDFRNLQSHILAMGANASAAESDEEGFQLLRRCFAEAQQLLREPFAVEPPGGKRGEDEESAKYHFRRWVLRMGCERTRTDRSGATSPADMFSPRPKHHRRRRGPALSSAQNISLGVGGAEVDGAEETGVGGTESAGGGPRGGAAATPGAVETGELGNTTGVVVVGSFMLTGLLDVEELASITDARVYTALMQADRNEGKWLEEDPSLQDIQRALGNAR
jgi:hypothetical protein